MSLMARPRWTRQPQGAVTVDWSNPLTRRLRLCYFPSDRLDRISNKFISVAGTVPTAYAPKSAGASFTNNSANYLGSTTNGSPIQTTTADYRLSLFALVVPNSTATQQAITALNGAGTERTRLEISATGAPGYVVRQVNAGVAASINATQTVVAGQQVAIAGVSYAQNSHTVYVNGIAGGTSTTSINSANSTYDRHYIGIDFPGGIGASLPGRSLIQLVLGWNRALTASEIAQISANPWQIFRPVTRTIGAVISGVSIYRPSSDISLTGWTGVPDNTNLYANIDEVTPSDTDYITSLVTGASPATMGIGPISAGSYIVRVRAATTSGTGTVRVKLQDSSGTTLGTSADQAIDSTPTSYDLSLSISATAARVSIEIA